MSESTIIAPINNFQVISSFDQNSTEDLPDMSLEWTGEWELTNRGDVGTTLKTDVTGTLFYEFANQKEDGSTPTAVTSTFPVNGFAFNQFNEFHTAVKLPRWFRVRIVYDSTPTSVSLNTFYGQIRQGNLPLNQSISDDQDSSVVQSVLIGQTPAGEYEKVLISQSRRLNVDAGLPIATFSDLVTTNRRDQVTVNFSEETPENVVVTSSTGSGDVINVAAQSVVSSGTTSTSTAKMNTRRTVKYRPSHEIYAFFTATFSSPTANGSQFIGLYDDDNGFAIGYNGTDFCIRRRDGGDDTDILLDDFNGELLTRFTRDGDIETLNPQFGNVYRIRFGWLGNAPIVFEALTPDGEWISMHSIRYPNTSTTAHIENPDLPLTSEVSNGGDSVDVSIATSSWAAGITIAPQILETIFQRRTPDDSALPSGTSITIDPVLNTESNVLDSGWIFVGDDYPGGQLLSITTDQAVDVYLMNASDDQGNNIVGNSVKTLTTTAGFPSVSGAPFFDDYYRLVIINTSGTSVNDYTIRSQGFGATTPASVYASINSPVFDFFPAPLTRSITTGRQPDGSYVNTPSDGTLGSYDTNLGSNDSDTLGPFSTVGHKTIELYVATDQVSATDGYQVSYTDDPDAGSPTYYPGPKFTFTADDVTNGFFIKRFAPALSGFKLDFQNGGVAQTTNFINLEAKIGQTENPSLSVENDIDATQAGIATRGVVYAKNDANNYSNITQSDNGGFRTSTVEHEVDTPIASLSNGTTSGLSVLTSATRVDSSQLTGRKTFAVKTPTTNNKSVFIGFNSSVTTSNGYPLASGDAVEVDLDLGEELWAIADSSTQNIRLMQVGD
jgi:hypothetical protein